MPTQSQYVTDKLFAIRNTGRHLALQSPTWHDLDSYVRLFLIEEILKLCHIIKHKGIFSELHLDENSPLHEVDLLESILDDYGVIGESHFKAKPNLLKAFRV